MLGRPVFGLVALAAAAGALPGCDRKTVKSDIELTSPTQRRAETDKAAEAAFGQAVGETLRADANSVPRDPAPEDVAPVSYTAEPIPIPAD